MGEKIEVRIMESADVLPICRADGDESEENKGYLNRQLKAQERKECSGLLALYDGEIAGYVFVYYKCRWGGMADQGIPGIVDLIVFEKYRRKKIGTALMDMAEKISSKYCDRVYLDVCLNREYGPAQRFYVKSKKRLCPRWKGSIF